MTKLRNRIAAAAGAISLGVGLFLTATPAAQAAPVSCMPAKASLTCSKYWGNRVTAGSKSHTNDVNLQRSLVQAGFNIFPINGKLSAKTVSRLKEFQRSRGLKVTGWIDAATVKALRAGQTKPVAKKPVTKKKTTAHKKTTVTKKTTKKTTSSSSSSTKAAKAVSFAYKQLGKPYRYGATGPSSYDCSGLTGAAWKAAGIKVPRTSYAQLGKYKRVSKSNLKPGDIVGFYGGGHVAIYVGNGYVIHASRPGRPIAKVKLSTMPFYKAVRSY